MFHELSMASGIPGGGKMSVDQVLALRPFVPAKDFQLSKRFYRALGFELTFEDETVAFLKIEGFSFILRNLHPGEAADNQMIQLLVRDADAWWRRIDADRLVAEFAVKPPRPPAMQPWKLKVGFVFDPSGVLWHIAEAPF
jgi:catechol 2,3-dioxygenase-like lactoylglutathione lyase family enzyme